MKKISRAFGIIITVVSIMAITAVASMALSSNDYEYLVTSEDAKTAEITRYTGTATTITIPAEINGYIVTSLGTTDVSATFSSVVTNINMPNTVVSINAYAFKNCTTITNISIPNSVTVIGKEAFYGCDSLSDIEMPESVTKIGDKAFNGCIALTTLTIPQNIAKLDNYIFKDCTGLTDVTINAQSGGIGSFQGCTSLVNVTFNNIVRIENETFKGCTGLQTIDIPESVTTIGQEAFNNCTSLANITMGNALESIGYQAFSNTAWYNAQPDGQAVLSNWLVSYKGDMPANTEVFIGYPIKGIADKAFANCYGMTKVEIRPGNTIIIGAGSFLNCTGITKVNMHVGVTSIGKSAFAGCSGITSVIITKKVEYIGDDAFLNCPNLSKVDVSYSVVNIGEHAFGFLYDGEEYSKVSGLVIKGYDNSSTKNYAMYYDFAFGEIIPHALGDVNGDGLIDVIDYQRIDDVLSGCEITDLAEFDAADVDKDGVIDVLDAFKMNGYISGYGTL
ncbi:MAG: leucine-rich repeat protein [Oscillospiraceae bacterium]